MEFEENKNITFGPFLLFFFVIGNKNFKYRTKEEEYATMTDKDKKISML